jgi:ABC-2 type transport system permease protein
MFLIKSNPIRIANTFVWLILDIFQWGLISRYMGTMGDATFNFVSVILGAVILWEFFSRIEQGIMTAFLEDIWSNNFINFFASPLKIKEYLGGLVLSGIFNTVCGLSFIIIIAGLLFDYNFFKIGFMALPFILVLFVFGMAMGFLVSGIIFRFGPSAEWLAWPIPMMLSLVSGVFYPIATLPDYLQVVAKIVPPAYIFESLRAIVGGSDVTINISQNFFISAGLALIYLFLMYKFFVKIYRRNMNSGSLARFNAE